MKRIDVSTPSHPLTFALVDDEDFELLSTRKWSACKCGKARTLYVYYTKRAGSEAPTAFMHRLVMGAASGQHVDHIDGNGLNNQKRNLRFCTITENNRNSKKRKSGVTSKFKGVDLHRGKYRARVRVGRQKRINIGYFSSDVEAAKAYNEAALKYHGEFASLNEIPV